MESIETSVRNAFKAIDAGDRAALREYTTTKDVRFPASIFDSGPDGKPIGVEGVEAVQTFLDPFLEDISKNKFKFASTVSNLRTGSSSPELGFAVYELTHAMTMDGKTVTMKLRVTELLSYDAKTNKWRMFHIHVSPAGTAAK